VAAALRWRYWHRATASGRRPRSARHSCLVVVS